VDTIARFLWVLYLLVSLLTSPAYHFQTGHSQQLHETSHGSMSKSQWAIDGPDGTVLEVDGHRFGSDDDGAPMMCNLVCANLGRHTHLDYCRSADGQLCTGAEIQHVARNVRFNPNPNQSKDWITHSLFWRRSGMFPYNHQTCFEVTLFSSGFKGMFFASRIYFFSLTIDKTLILETNRQDFPNGT
jgi:hypothetical protein